MCYQLAVHRLSCLSDIRSPKTENLSSVRSVPRSVVPYRSFSLPATSLFVWPYYNAFLGTEPTAVSRLVLPLSNFSRFSRLLDRPFEHPSFDRPVAP